MKKILMRRAKRFYDAGILVATIAGLICAIGFCMMDSADQTIPIIIVLVGFAVGGVACVLCKISLYYKLMAKGKIPMPSGKYLKSVA